MRQALLALLLAACLPAIGAGAQPRAFGNLEAAVEAALEDARSKTTLSVEVTGSEEVTWRDASLGCPQRGLAYGQALVPGYRVRLKAGAQEFDYHASARGALVLCPPGRSKPPARSDPTR